MSVEYANATRVETPEGTIRAPQCILAVSGFAPGFGAFERRVLPMMAHASLSRPLTGAEQVAWGVASALRRSSFRARRTSLKGNIFAPSLATW